MSFDPSPLQTTDLTAATRLLPNATAPGLTDLNDSLATRSSTAISLGTALNNGAIAGRRIIANDVGNGDLWDVQQFQTTTTSDLTLNLSGLQADADLYLVQDLNGNGLWDLSSELIASSRNAGTLADSLSVTGLAAGNYYALVATYDGFFTNYALSITTDVAGSSLATAGNLGTPNGTVTISDFVGTSDPRDFYTFQTNATGNVQLNLTGLTADADLFLIRDNNLNGIVDTGDVLMSSTQAGTSSEFMNYEGLAAGRYFVGVAQYSGDTNYSLSVTTDGAGNTLSTARNLGTLNGSLTLNDFVGTADPADIYTFQTTATSDFQLSMTGLTADADVSLIRDINANGIIDANDILVSSTQAGSSSEAINYAGLAAGRYFVRVYQYSGDTNYTLNVSAIAASDIGNTYATAANIGLISGQRSFTGSVGGSDTGDMYRFAINANSNLQLDLTGLTADADLFLVQDVNLNGVYDAGDLLAFSTRDGAGVSEQINTNNLAAGNYFAWVTPFSGTTNYTLTLTTDAAGNTLSTARDIGILNGPRSYSDFVGNSDPLDFYRFQVGSPTTVNVSLTGLTADADLRLIRDVNGNGLVDSADIIVASINAGTAAENLTANLATGTYFVQVNQFVPLRPRPKRPPRPIMCCGWSRLGNAGCSSTG